MTDNYPYDEIFNDYPETFEEKLNISIQYAQMVVDMGIHDWLWTYYYMRTFKETGLLAFQQRKIGIDFTETPNKQFILTHEPYPL